MNKSLMILIAGLGTAVSVQGAFFTFSGASIPDPGSHAFVGTVSTLTGYVSGLTVSLSISGETVGHPAFNGDLYVTLQHESGFAVLLNRPGRTALNPYGYPDNGMEITLDDSGGAPDVHTYQVTLGGPPSGPLTGTWSSDGRNVDPKNVLDTTPRTTSLGSFLGAVANGDWCLFVADLSKGGNARVTSWGLSIDTVPVIVPEPAWGGVLAGLGLGTWAWMRRRAQAV